MVRRRAPLAALAAAALLASGCGTTTAVLTPKRTPSGSAAQVRVDAFATVAQRLYREEASGPAGQRAALRIAGDARLLAALRSGDRAAIRAAALHQLFLPAKHVVRLRVAHGGNTVVDVGGTFVAAAAHRELRAPDGTDLGRLEVSMQDIIGLVKLIHRFTGADAVVHGRPGHVIGTASALLHARIPHSGTVTIAGRAYVVRSFARTGFDGEPLRISVLDPA